MSHKTLMDDKLVNHECVVCERCGTTRTIEVADSIGWDLKKDICNACLEFRARPKKITRRQLLKGIGQLQNLIGKARGDYYNDRAHNRADLMEESLTTALNLCIYLRKDDPPD